LRVENRLTRQDLLTVNASSFGVLVAGLLNTLLLPKMALHSIGVENYGLYALLLGACLIPTVFDFGLMPGLTREIGSLYAQGRVWAARGVTRRVQTVVGGLGAVAVLCTAVLVAVPSVPRSSVALSVVMGGGANVIVMITEIGLLRVRVMGKIATANLYRGLYLATYLACTGLFFASDRLTMVTLFLAQFMGSVVYLWLGISSERYVQAERESGERARATEWRRLFRSAFPEQIGRAQSALLPGVERAMMLGAAGTASVASYDIAVRLSAIVTALPAALSEPMVALLSPRMGGKSAAERLLILRHGSQANHLLAFVTLGVGLMAACIWAIPYYGIAEMPFLVFVFTIMVGSACNVLTAPYVGALYAIGRSDVLIAKSLGDLFVAVGGLCVLAVSSSVTAYVLVRYMGYVPTAGGLLLYWFVKRRALMGGAG
jgi:O-antigen/teichoic acid export membrane protein